MQTYYFDIPDYFDDYYDSHMVVSAVGENMEQALHRMMQTYSPYIHAVTHLVNVPYVPVKIMEDLGAIDPSTYDVRISDRAWTYEFSHAHGGAMVPPTNTLVASGKVNKLGHLNGKASTHWGQATFPQGCFGSDDYPEVVAIHL